MPSPGLRQQQMVRTKLLNSAPKLHFPQSNGLKGMFAVSVTGESVSLDVSSCSRMNQCCLWQSHSAYCVVCRHNNAATTVQKLHDKLAAYMWECHGCRGLGEVSEHYIRGKDMTGFAAGTLLTPHPLCCRVAHLRWHQHACFVVKVCVDLNMEPNPVSCHAFLGHISGILQPSSTIVTSSFA